MLVLERVLAAVGYHSTIQQAWMGKRRLYRNLDAHRRIWTVVYMGAALRADGMALEYCLLHNVYLRVHTYPGGGIWPEGVREEVCSGRYTSYSLHHKRWWLILSMTATSSGIPLPPRVKLLYWSKRTRPATICCPEGASQVFEEETHL